MFGFILFVLGLIFTASLIVGFLYILPGAMIVAIVAILLYYIIDSIRKGMFD